MNEHKQNKSRAQSVAKALKEYDPDNAVCDFLADLLHYCHQNEIDFGLELARGTAHYAEEIRDETILRDHQEPVVYKTWFNTVGDPEGKFNTNAKVYDTVGEAEIAARDLFLRWTATKFWRVIGTDGNIYAEGG